MKRVGTRDSGLGTREASSSLPLITFVLQGEANRGVGTGSSFESRVPSPESRRQEHRR